MKIYHETNIDYHRLGKSWAGFLSDWDWEMHFTLSFIYKVDFGTAVKEVKRWFRELRRVLSEIKYAGVLIFSNPHNETPHVHILLVSDPQYPRRLTDVSRLLRTFMVFSWENRFVESNWVKGTCRIDKVWDSGGISNYIAKPKNITLWDPDRWEFHYYRLDLLKRLRRCSDSG
jgi:hypothetical protein